MKDAPKNTRRQQRWRRTIRTWLRKQPKFKLRQPRFLTADHANAKRVNETLSNGGYTTTEQRETIRGGRRRQRWSTAEAQQKANNKSRTSTNIHRKLHKGQHSATGLQYSPTTWRRTTLVYTERELWMATDPLTTHRRLTMTTHERRSQTLVYIWTRTLVVKRNLLLVHVPAKTKNVKISTS